MPDSVLDKRSKPQRRGYVLLVVLAVSVLVVTVLATLAKVSLRRGLQAADAQRSLQQRWGALTLEKSLLYRAPKVFELREKIAAQQTPGLPPTPFLRTAVSIGGVTFDMLLADEDAKLNLNSLYHHAGQREVEQAIAKIAGPAFAMAAELTPVTPPLLLSRQSPRLLAGQDESENEREIPDAFRSWGEVFDLGRLRRATGIEAGLPIATTGITCWGSGQLNFRRASDDAILAAAGSVIQDGGARRMLQRYRKNPTSALGVLIETEVNTPANRRRLRGLLSETSTNFSLWIHASAKTGKPYQQFIVMSRDDEGVTRYQKFAY